MDEQPMNQTQEFTSPVLGRITQNAIAPTYPDKPRHQGMPPFDPSGPPLSFYEFWPPRLFYIPICIQWILLSIRYGSATLPSVANPLFPLGGLVGESKEMILSQVSGNSAGVVARFAAITRGRKGADAGTDADRAEGMMRENNITYPAVAKPDIGCRGAGVQIVRDSDELLAYLQSFPVGGRMLLQELVPYEGEAGVFYVRPPNATQGIIFSLTLKYFPYVQGDGVSSLKELIERDRRAGLIKHVYLKRHEKHLDTIIPQGQNFRLAFTGSHSRGTIFRNGNAYITAEMAATFDKISHDIPEFYFGRFDVRFPDYKEFQKGRGFKIVEINGAGGEATHIWDRKTPIMEAYRTLMKQFNYLFKIGAHNRRRGFKPASPMELWRAYRTEKKLTPLYPHTE
jgi:hypothetical protein